MSFPLGHSFDIILFAGNVKTSLLQNNLVRSTLYNTIQHYTTPQEGRNLMSFRWQDYVHMFEPGDLKSRQDLADIFGVGRSTSRYHLERAVKNGALNKMFGWTGLQSGWLYALPDTLPRLEGI